VGVVPGKMFKRQNCINDS